MKENRVERGFEFRRSVREGWSRCRGWSRVNFLQSLQRNRKRCTFEKEVRYGTERVERGFEFRRSVREGWSRYRGWSRLNFLQNLQKSPRNSEVERNRKRFRVPEKRSRKEVSIQRLIETQFFAKFAKNLHENPRSKGVERGFEVKKKVSKFEEGFEKGGLNAEADRDSIFCKICKNLHEIPRSKKSRNLPKFSQKNCL